MNDPIAISERYKTAYGAYDRARRQSYSPYDEGLFSRFTQGPPTPSILGEVARGALTALAARRLGDARLAYEEDERRRQREEAMADWQTQREALQRDRLGVLGLEHGLKFAETAADPTKFAMTPAQRGNVDTVTGLMTTNPEFQRATDADPSFPTRAVRSVVSPNPELGLPGLQPRTDKSDRYLYRAKDGYRYGLFDPSGTLLADLGAAPPKDVGGGVSSSPVMYQTPQGGYRWGLVDDAGNLVRDLRAATEKELGDQHDPLAPQKLINDVVSGYFGKTTIDVATGNRVTEIPAEARKAALGVASRAKVLLDAGKVSSATEAALTALDEFEQQGLVPVGPTDRRFPLNSVYGLTPPQFANLRTVGGLFETNPEFQRAARTDPTFPSRATQSIMSPPVDGAMLAPDNQWYVRDPSRPGKYLHVGDDSRQPSPGSGPPPPVSSRAPTPEPGSGHGDREVVGYPRADKGLFFERDRFADPLVFARPIGGSDLWEYEVNGRVYRLRNGGQPMRRSLLTGERGKQPFVPVSP